MANAPSTEAVSRIVRWAILLFIAYAVLTGSWHILPEKQPPEPQPPAQAKAPAPVVATTATPAEKDCANQSPNALQNFGQMAVMMAPSLVPVTRVAEVTPGTGEAAFCGQHAMLRYQLATDNGRVVFSNMKDGEMTDSVIGEGRLLHGMEMGLQGMKPGGERKIAFPPALGLARVKDPHQIIDTDKYGVKPDELKGQVLVADMSLVSSSPPMPTSSMPLRLIDRQYGPGQRVQCGDTVSVDIAVYKTDGAKIFSTDDTHQPVILTVGRSQAPFGIEQALLNLGENETRTAIIPPAFTHPLLKDAVWDKPPRLLGADITWPEETLLMNVHMQHIGGDPAYYSTASAAAAMPVEDAPKETDKTKDKAKEKDDDDDEPDEKK